MKTKDIIMKLVVISSITLVIRSIGIDGIPPIGVVGIYLFGIICLVWGIIKVKKEKRKDKYYMIFAFNVIALFISSIILYITNNVFLVHYILLPITFCLYISTAISIFAWAIASNKNKR